MYKQVGKSDRKRADATDLSELYEASHDGVLLYRRASRFQHQVETDVDTVTATHTNSQAYTPLQARMT